MNCEEIRAKLSLYLDHMLSQKDAQMVCRHLNSCQSGGKEARELSEISRLLGQLPQKPVPDVFWQRMDQALHEERKEKTKRTRRGSALFSGKKRLWRTVAGAAAVFVVCVLSYSMFSDHLSLPDIGTSDSVSQSWNSDENSQTDPTASLNQQPSGQKNGKSNKKQSDLASGAVNAAAPKEKEDRASNQDSKSGAASSAQKSATAPTAQKSAAASSAQKSAASPTAKKPGAASSAPKSAAPSAKPEPFAAFAAPETGGPESENLMRSRSFSMDNAIESAQSDGAVSNLADAINQKDLKKMEQSISLAGYTDQLEDRAKVALSFYRIIFDGEPISWESIKEEPQQKNESFEMPQQKKQSNVRQYQLSSENRTLELSVIQKEDTLTLQEGILQYSYELDQAMAGAAYQLKDYTPQNEAGCPEFTLLLKQDSAGIDQTVTYVGCNGKVSRKDEIQPASTQVPDHMEGK